MPDLQAILTNSTKQLLVQDPDPYLSDKEGTDREDAPAPVDKKVRAVSNKSQLLTAYLTYT
jgi:hypothetical protein